MRLVGEAVAEFKGEKTEVETDVKVDLPVDAHLPHDYIPGERLRLEAYRKLAAVHDMDGLDAVRAEVVDRYGPLPQPVEHLFAVAAFRVKARKSGLTEVSLQGRNVRFSPMVLPESKVMRLQRLYPGASYKNVMNTVIVPRPATARVGGQPLRDTALLDWAADLIDALTDQPVAAAAT